MPPCPISLTRASCRAKASVSRSWISSIVTAAKREMWSATLHGAGSGRHATPARTTRRNALALPRRPDVPVPELQDEEEPVADQPGGDDPQGPAGLPHSGEEAERVAPAAGLVGVEVPGHAEKEPADEPADHAECRVSRAAERKHDDPDGAGHPVEREDVPEPGDESEPHLQQARHRDDGADQADGESSKDRGEDGRGEIVEVGTGRRDAAHGEPRRDGAEREVA